MTLRRQIRRLNVSGPLEDAADVQNVIKYHFRFTQSHVDITLLIFLYIYNK